MFNFAFTQSTLNATCYSKMFGGIINSAIKSFLVMLLIFIPLVSVADNQVLLTDNFLDNHTIQLNENEETHLGSSWQFWINESELDTKQVIDNNQLSWQAELIDKANHIFDEREYWFRFRIAPNAQKQNLDQSYIIEVAYSLLDEIDVYEVSNGEIVNTYISGDKFPFKDRFLEHHDFLFPFIHKPVATDFYIRIKTTSTVQVPILIWPNNKFWEKDRTTSYFNGLLYGGFFIMMLYNFFVFLNIKDSAYFFYVLYIASLVSTLGAMSGIGYQYFWPTSPLIQDLVLAPSLAGVLLFASIFFIKLFGLKDKFKTYYRFSVVCIFIIGFLPFTRFFLSYSENLILIAVIASCIGFIGLIMTFQFWLKGISLSGYFIVGLGAVFIAFVTYGLSLIGILSRTLFIEYVVIIAFLFEIIIFSYALAYRISLERKLRIDTQAALLETQRQINTELDTRVKEKTQELEIANEKLQDLALTDRLTGVKNRRFFDDRALSNYRTAFREQQSIGLLLIDIDNFKSINDIHGHLLGDQCLKDVAQTLESLLFRPADSISRYGGEEFVILLPSTSFNGAKVVAEKMRKAINDLEIISAEGVEIDLSISVGALAYVPKIRNGLDNFIQKADEQMYLAKEAGKNCVVASDSESNDESNE